LPPEVYARPEAALIPELLLTKGTDDNARLALAERSAARGIISAAQLGAAYKSAVFTPEEITGANASTEKTSRSRALLYQGLSQEQLPAKKIDLAAKILDGVEPEALTGSLPFWSRTLWSISHHDGLQHLRGASRPPHGSGRTNG
jgi:hypothetical protein